ADQPPEGHAQGRGADPRAGSVAATGHERARHVLRGRAGRGRRGGAGARAAHRGAARRPGRGRVGGVGGPPAPPARRQRGRVRRRPRDRPPGPRGRRGARGRRGRGAERRTARAPERSSEVSVAPMASAVFDTVVVGAGVVGLAIARAEAMRGREVVILEGDARFGNATSSRNSEVIHAGIYNPTDTLKTRLCVAGRPLLYRYCEARGVDHRVTGKLLVANDAEEEATLERLIQLSRANGIAGDDALVPLSAREAKRLEPELACTAAALSPSTGVVDAEQLMRALLGD